MTPAQQVKPLVAVATYNEIQSLPTLVEGIFARLPAADILVVDDNSPDGTGTWCQQRAAEDARLRCLHRAAKMGLGSATVAAFQYAIDHGYSHLVTMDADMSHHPGHLPAVLAAQVESPNPAAAVAIGSRYVAGGAIRGWPLVRRVSSRCVNHYSRWLLGLPINDCTGAFRCYPTALLAQIPLDQIRSPGYSFQEEILWHLKRCGATFVEVPIVFENRQQGASKVDARESLSSLWIIFRLGLTNWLGC